MGFAAVQRTAYDFLQQEQASQENYCDLVAAVPVAAPKTFPSDPVQFQFFHETGPGIANRIALIKLYHLEIDDYNLECFMETHVSNVSRFTKGITNGSNARAFIWRTMDTKDTTKDLIECL